MVSGECQYIDGICGGCGHQQVAGVRRACRPVPSHTVVVMEAPPPTLDDLPADFIAYLKTGEMPKQATQPAGLGDMVAAGLGAIGITKARAQAVASAFGVSDCGCPQRQQAMNEWAAKNLGIGVPKEP